MSNWSLAALFAGLHDDIEQRLSVARKSFGHSGTKGDAAETAWLKLLQDYLPKRYQVDKAHAVDSKGTFSEQLDVVIFDRQYSPFIFNFQDKLVVPAESIYAAFEAKQTINDAHVKYAKDKLTSVRNLHRTSIPIPHAGGTNPAKELHHIIGGILTLESDWKPPLGEPLMKVLADATKTNQIDLGCVAVHGAFYRDTDKGNYLVHEGGKPAAAFILELISRLQAIATVPMIDVRAYAQWLDK